MMQTRAISAGVLAALALFAVLCVVQNDDHIAEELIGNARLVAQKNAILAIEKAKKAGKDLDSIDTMVRGFTAEPKITLDKSFQESLANQAPKGDSLAAAFSAEALGLVKRAPNGLLQFNDEMSLVQTDEDYSNDFGAKTDITTQIAAAKQQQEEQDRDEDSKLLGNSLVDAAAAVNKQFDSKNMMKSTMDAKELMFVQTEASWEPMGQQGMKDAISTAHTNDEKDALIDDELENDVVLKSIKQPVNEGQGWNGEDLELGFVQTSATEWKPQGQPGLSDTIGQVKADTQHQQDLDDGLIGDDILSGAGLAQETSLIQRPPVWSPAPLHVKNQVAHPMHQQDDAEAIVAKREMASWEKHPEREEELGDSVLAAAGLGHHMLKGNMADRAGVMTGDELSIDDLLN